MPRPRARITPPTPDTGAVMRDVVDHWEAAERLAAAAMRAWGYTDAAVTTRGADGGIDVRSRRAVAQVKFVTAKTGRPDIQKLVGASRPDLQRFFFSRSGYSKTAVTFAVSAGVALFTYDRLGRVYPANAHASTVLRQAPRHRPAPAAVRPVPTQPLTPPARPMPPAPRPTSPRARRAPSQARVGFGDALTATARWVGTRWAELAVTWVWLFVALGVVRLVQVGPDKLTQLVGWTVMAVAGTVWVARRRRRHRSVVPVSHRDDVVNCPPTGTPRG